MERFVPQIRKVPVSFDPFAGPAIVSTVPTTEAQREVWTAAQMGEEASLAYNESVTLELTGELRTDALRQAFTHVVGRHEALHAVCDSTGKRMIVLAEMEIPLLFLDLRERSGTDRNAEMHALGEEDMQKPFDLLNGPLLRAWCVTTGDRQHHLRLTGHHIVCDGWSLGILMAEISQAYSALVEGRSIQLPPAIPFSAYTMALMEFSKSAEYETVKQYWADQFKGPLPRLDLPTDRPRPRQRSFKGDRLDMTLPIELVQGLRAVATRSGSSFVTALLTSFELLIHEMTGDSDVIVGLPAAGQSDMDMKHLVGHCVNLLPLRSRIDEERSFLDHLKERRSAVLDAYDNQRYTYGTLVRELNVPREPGRIPLVPVVFNIDMNMDDGVGFSGLDHRFVSNPRAYENFELFLNATGKEDHLILEWSYNSDLFDASTVKGWMDDLTLLLARINTDPTATIGTLLGNERIAGEQDPPDPKWEGVAGDIELAKGIAARFDEVAVEHSESVALSFLEKEVTYRELKQRVHALAAQLEKRGIRTGEPVGLCVDRSVEMIVAMLAILRSGGCFVPFDPAYPQERLSYMMQDTNVRLLLTQRHLLDTIPDTSAELFLLEDLPELVTNTGVPKGKGDDPAYIMYTSGSTGKPKGVVVPQRAITRLVTDQNFLPFGPDLVFLQLSNISFDASTLEIWGALLNGGRLVLQPQQKPTLLEITETIQRNRVTTVWLTAGLFNLLVDDQVDRLVGLRHILTGGDVLSMPHVKKALRVLGPGVLINGYGPTENTTFTCCHPITEKSIARGSIPIGRPIAHTTVHILDEQMQRVPIGTKGELYTGGDGLALGYWGQEELTRERFVADPFSKTPGARMYRTGDLVRWLPDGEIEFIGRSDDQVKVRGFRIELGEIENALNGLEGLKDRVVIVRQDVPGEKQLVCYMVPTNEQDAENATAKENLVQAARNAIRAALPDHMLPGTFVVLPAFPLNPNGKVDKKALPMPVLREHVLRAQFVAPRDAKEKQLSAIWSDLLGVKRIGVHDNFFDLGGHSLIGIDLLAQVEERFKVRLSLKALFQAPTIAQFSELLQMESPGPQFTNLTAIQPEGDLLPFFCVHGDEGNYFIPKYLGNERPFYAFFHQGEDGRRIPFTTVPEIAAHFIDEMRRVRQHGPYLLGGYSFGGIVAYEMARQLIQAGERVPELVLLDTYAPEAYARIMQQEQRFYDPLKKAILRRAARYYLANNRILPPRLRHFYIIDTYDRAILDYDPGTYPGDITVIRAQASGGSNDLGWSSTMPANLTVKVVPGDHYNIIKEPYVEQLVVELDRTLRKVNRASAVEAV